MPSMRRASALDAVPGETSAEVTVAGDTTSPGSEGSRIEDRPTWLAPVGGLLVLVGLVLWATEVRDLDLRAMSDLGLASVFPVLLWAGTLCVALGSVLTLVARRVPYIVLSLAATVLVNPGLGVVAEENMRFVVAWRHVGVVQHLAGTGSIDPSIDAYFNWPGFFAFFSFLQESAGLSDVQVVAQYAPLVLNALCLVPLYVIGRATIGSPWATWTGVWLFAAFNWIGQDYFSPQGLYLFVYLVILAVVLSCFRSVPVRLRWLHRGDSGRPTASAPPVPDTADSRAAARQRTALAGALLVLIAATVASHQLTPFALVLTLGAMAFIRLTYLRGLAVVTVLMVGAWLVFAAETYVAGHSDEIFGGLASLADSLGQNVGQRVEGSPGHQVVVQLRLVAAALLWALAAWGAVRRWRAGHDLRWILVPALVPFLLLAMQSYGGEALLRAALFTSPFMCLLAAGVFVGPRDGRFPVRGAALLALTGVAIFVLFPFARWGNERMDWYSDEEVGAVSEMYEIVPEGSIITAVTDALPWRGQAYADHDYRLLTVYEAIGEDNVATEGLPADETESVDLDAADEELLLAQVQARMAAEPGRCSVLVVTRAQQADLQLNAPFADSALPRLEELIRGSGDFRTLVSNQDARVYSLGICEGAAA